MQEDARERKEKCGVSEEKSARLVFALLMYPFAKRSAFGQLLMALSSCVLAQMFHPVAVMPE